MNRLIYLLNNKKGSVSVFVVIAFACFILLASVFYTAAKSAAGRSYADAAFQLAGRSVLSEYDRKLLEDYGVMAFRGNEKMIEDDIKYYAGASLNSDSLLYLPYRKNSADHIDTINPKMGNITANLKEYSLLDLDNFEDQLKAGVITEWLDNWKSKNNRIKNDNSKDTDEKNRELKSKSIIASLPSAGYDAPFFPTFNRTEDIPFFEDVMMQGTTSFATSEYIISVFSNNLYSFDTEDRFFKNEVEYIINGKKSDKSNYDWVYWKIFGMRFLLNQAAILLDSQKKAEIEAVAIVVGLLTEGVGQKPTEVLLTETWVTAETRNDMRLLQEGEKVALWKTKSQWATENLLEIVDGFVANEPLKPASGGGLDYEDYLRILLYLTDREVKLLRIMDLIQINLKGSYYKEFLLREHYIGFRVECEYDKDKFSYIHKY